MDACWIAVMVWCVFASGTIGTRTRRTAKAGARSCRCRWTSSWHGCWSTCRRQACRRCGRTDCTPTPSNPTGRWRARSWVSPWRRSGSRFPGRMFASDWGCTPRPSVRSAARRWWCTVDSHAVPSHRHRWRSHLLRRSPDPLASPARLLPFSGSCAPRTRRVAPSSPISLAECGIGGLAFHSGCSAGVLGQSSAASAAFPTAPGRRFLPAAESRGQAVSQTNPQGLSFPVGQSN